MTDQTPATGPEYRQTPPYGTPHPGQTGAQGMPQAPQASGYGQPPPYVQGGAPPYAHWGLRVGAALVDGIAVYAFVIVGMILGGGPKGGVYALFVVLGIAFAVWNYAWRQGRTGRSVGKSAVKTRLVKDADGQLVGAGLALVRQIAHIIDGLPLYLGYLWPLWDRKRQTFADKVCGTVVVKG